MPDTLTALLDEETFRGVPASRLRECPDCGQFCTLPAPKTGSEMLCPRCRKTLRRIRRHALDITLACTLAGFVLYLLALSAPFLRVVILGRFRTSLLGTGPRILSHEGLWEIGLIVLFTTIVIPLFKFASMLIVLLGLRLEHPPRFLVALFRWNRRLSIWAMLEVYLLGFLVAYTRLQQLAHVQIDVAVYALAGAMFAMAAADVALDPEEVWQRMCERGIASGHSPKKRGERLIGCHACYQVSMSAPGDACPRCAARLHVRKPDSLNRAWAFAISAAIFYLPANYFPVMHITKLGKTTAHTILGGMFEFIRIGMWPLALLVFVASVAIPLLKLVTLSYMMIETHQGSDSALLNRTRLYRLIDFIGRWSMVDVFMVSILVALVQFGRVAEVTSDLGGVCFGMVVVLTMLAVESFDPRLMWDRAGQHAAAPDENAWPARGVRA